MTYKFIHFHPNGQMAEKFVRPIIDKEIEWGYYSTLICDTKKINNNTFQIPFKLKFYNFFYIFFISIYLVNFIKTKKITHFIVHNSSTAIIPLLLGRLLNLNYIVYVNHGVPHIGYKGIIKIILFCLEYLNCKLAKNIVTVSTDMRKELQKITSKNITIIHHGSASGLNLKAFAKRNKNPNRATFKISKEDFVILYIGRTEERKGYDFLITLWKKYFIDNNNYKLLICGNEKTYDDQSNIKHLGFVNNIPEILSSSNCLVLPSKHEGMPYAILESLAASCPVIASDIPGIRNLIKNNKNGILIKDFDMELYYQKIILLKNNKSFREKIIVNGLETAKKFSREDFLKQYYIYIKDVLSKKIDH